MKKTIIVLLCSCMLFLLGATAQAEDLEEVPMKETDILSKSADFKAIKKLEADMLFELEYLYEGSEVVSPDIPERIDYSEAVKIYVNTDIQYLETNEKSEIETQLEKSIYVWVIPMKISGENVRITLAKGLPLNEENANILSEEEKKEIRANEGNWTITEVARGVTESYLSQLASNSDVKEECDEVVLIGGIPGMHEPVALGFDDGKAENLYSLGYSYPIVNSMKSNSRYNIKKGISDEKYDFETIMKASQSYDTSENTLSGGAGGGGSIVGEESYTSIYIVVVPVIIISVIVAGVYFLYFKRGKEE